MPPARLPGCGARPDRGPRRAAARPGRGSAGAWSWAAGRGRDPRAAAGPRSSGSDGSGATGRRRACRTPRRAVARLASAARPTTSPCSSTRTIRHSAAIGWTIRTRYWSSSASSFLPSAPKPPVCTSTSSPSARTRSIADRPTGTSKRSPGSSEHRLHRGVDEGPRAAQPIVGTAPHARSGVGPRGVVARLGCDAAGRAPSTPATGAHRQLEPETGARVVRIGVEEPRDARDALVEHLARDEQGARRGGLLPAVLAERLQRREERVLAARVVVEQRREEPVGEAAQVGVVAQEPQQPVDIGRARVVPRVAAGLGAAGERRGVGGVTERTGGVVPAADRGADGDRCAGARRRARAPPRRG